MIKPNKYTALVKVIGTATSYNIVVILLDRESGHTLREPSTVSTFKAGHMQRALRYANTLQGKHKNMSLQVALSGYADSLEAWDRSAIEGRFSQLLTERWVEVDPDLERAKYYAQYGNEMFQDIYNNVEIGV